VSSEDEKKVLGDVMAIAGLFIISPAGYLLQVYILYSAFKGEPLFYKNEKIANLGTVLMFLGPPLCHWISYKYCQQQFGWFKKKR